MISAYVKNFFNLIICSMLLFACNNDNTNYPKRNLKNNSKNNNTVFMDLLWVVDNGVPEDRVSSGLHDTAWHLITVSVKRVGEQTKPQKVQGIEGVIYPTPKKNANQKIDIKDINCNTAIFKNVGDSCSVYFKLSYDKSLAYSDKIEFPILLYANNQDLPTIMGFTSFIWNNEVTQGNYRAVLPIESQYYTGNKVISDKLSYQIILMQNVTNNPIKINKLDYPQNTSFEVMHRIDNSDSDSYYGNISECSLNLVPEKKIINKLNAMDDYCIIVFKAKRTNDNKEEGDTLSIDTDASYFFPQWGTIYTLKAEYSEGIPIPSVKKYGAEFKIINGSAHHEGSAMVMDTNGKLSSDLISTNNLPFKSTDLSYELFPGTRLNIPIEIKKFNEGDKSLYVGGDINDYPNNLLHNGVQILTDRSKTNPVTVGNVEPMISPYSSCEIPPWVPHPFPFNCVSSFVKACGGAWVEAKADIHSSVELTRKNLTNLVLYVDSNAHCGNSAPVKFDINVPINEWYENQLYAIDDQGCGGKTWDIGAFVTVYGPTCDMFDNCYYNLELISTHGGVGDQCKDKQVQYAKIPFVKPKVFLQLSDLKNYEPKAYNPDSMIFLGGQKLSASFNGSSDYVPTEMNCNSFGKKFEFSCTPSGIYSNGSSVTSMEYSIDLLAKDMLTHGIVSFTKSYGYDLNSFTISQKFKVHE